MDEDTRKDERSAARGDLPAATKALALRLRSGELTADRVRLLAFLGHKPAVELVGEQPLDPDVTEWAHYGLLELGSGHDFFGGWCEHLVRHFPTIGLRAGLAAVQLLRASAPARGTRWPGDVAPPVELERLCHRLRLSTEDWALTGVEADRVQARGLAARLDAAVEEAVNASPLLGRSTVSGFGSVERSLAGLAKLPTEAEEWEFPAACRSALRCARERYKDNHTAMSYRKAGERMQAAISGELVPWLFGERDPLLQRRAERVE